MLSYNQIITKFQEFAEAHYLIESFGTGEAWQVVEHNKLKNRKYPMMWVEDLPIPYSQSEATYSFRVYFLSQVANLKNQTATTLEQTNVVEVKSDMLQCAQDLISFWVQDHNYDELDIDKSTTAVSFNQEFNDNLAGWYIDVKLVQAFKYNSCIIPMTGITPPPSETCDPVSTSMNGTSLTDTPSGGTKTFVIRYADDSAVTVTTIEDTATSFIGEVPNTATPLNTADQLKTGVFTSGRTGDDGDTQRGRLLTWFTLNHNNLWGHAFRFCGSTGGYTDGVGYYDVDGNATTYALAFPNDECWDWANWNQLTNEVYMWYLISQGDNPASPALPRGGNVGGKSIDDYIDESLASTQNGRTDWVAANENEINTIVYKEQAINSDQGLNYLPFEYYPTGSPSDTTFRLCTSTLDSTDTYGVFFSIENGNFLNQQLALLTRTYFLFRISDVDIDLTLP